MVRKNLKLDVLLKEVFVEKNKSYTFGKNENEKTDTYKFMIKWFEDFYGGTGEDNTKKTTEDLFKKGITNVLDIDEIYILQNTNQFVEYTIKGVRSYPKDKYLQSQKVEYFLTYLKEKYDLEMDLKPLENFKYRDQNERRLKILKHLHSGKKNRSEIAESFGISENTLNEDLKVLQSQDGYEFLGFKMKMSDLEYSENTYKSKVNPLFYAANMSEIYSLTIGLKLLSRGTAFEHALSPIADKIYLQLSDYAKKVIDKQSQDTDITFEGQKMHFLNTSEFYRDENLAFTYFLKESLPCKVTYYDKDSRELRTIKGDLELSDPDNDPGKKVKICTKTGGIELKVEDIRKVEKDENYKY